MCRKGGGGGGANPVCRARSICKNISIRISTVYKTQKSSCAVNRVCRAVCRADCRAVCRAVCRADCRADCRAVCRAVCRADCRAVCRADCRAVCRADCRAVCRADCRAVCRAVLRSTPGLPGCEFAGLIYWDEVANFIEIFHVSDTVPKSVSEIKNIAS